MTKTKRKPKAAKVAPNPRRRYMLLRGQLESVPMPYIYSRRAQSTLYRMVWRQTAAGDGLEELAAFAWPGFSWRIEDWDARDANGVIVRRWEL